jgi:ribosomal protein S6--L-glutamate ligase
MYENGGGKAIEKRIVEQLQERDIASVTGLNLRHSVAKRKGIECNDTLVNELDLFFSYNAGQQTVYQVYMYEVLNRYIPMVNSFKAFSISEDKLKTNMALAQADVNTPKFFMCHRDDTEELRKKAEKWDYKFVYKPVDGWGGMGMALIQNKEAFNMLLPFMNSADIRQFYIEEFVENDRSDFRVDIVDGKFIACYGRKAGNNDWRTNITSGGSVILREANDEIVNLAINAANALEMDIAGVDILYDQEKEEYVVLEVNGIPAFATPDQEKMGLNFNDKKIEVIVELIDRKSKK